MSASESSPIIPAATDSTPDVVSCTFMTSTPKHKAKLPHYHRLRDVAVPLRGQSNTRKRLFAAADDATGNPQHHATGKCGRTAPTESVHPQLLDNNMLLAGDTLYALYPLPETFCSDHCKIKPLQRPLVNCMLHLCGKDHLQRMKKLSSGRWAVSNLKLVEICGICYAVPANIRAHMMNLHEADLFTTHKRTDLCDVENFTVDIDVPVLEGMGGRD